MSLEQWAQIGTLLIATLAFFISVWSVYLQNKYSRISVRPYLLRNIIMDKLNKRIVVSIKNTGLGPAFIKSVTFDIDGIEQSEGFSLTKYADKTVNEYDLFYDIIYSVSEISSGLVIKEGESLEVLNLTYRSDDKDKVNKIHQLVDGVGYKIEYQSAFGDKEVF